MTIQNKTLKEQFKTKYTMRIKIENYLITKTSKILYIKKSDTNKVRNISIQP